MFCEPISEKMNYELVMSTRSGWLPKFQLELNLRVHHHLHIRLLLPPKPRHKPTPPNNPSCSHRIPTCQQLLK